MQADEPDVELLGGSMNRVVRRGAVVHREPGPWTPTIHRLLTHLHAGGIDWLPRPLGLDEAGREVLTYLPGTVPSYPMPVWVWTDEVLADAARRLAEVHRASAGFDRVGAVWQLPAREPDEVVCLNDVAPYNMVFDDAHRLVGLIDVDTAAPGPRAWDLAYLACRLVPLTSALDIPSALGAGEPGDLAGRRERLRLLGAAYAEAGDRVRVPLDRLLDVAVARLEELAAFSRRRADAGAEHVRDHVVGYLAGARWIERHASDLLGEQP